MLFRDNKIFKKAVIANSVKHGKVLQKYRNECGKVGFTCNEESYGWKIYASKMQKEDTLQAKI